MGVGAELACRAQQVMLHIPVTLCPYGTVNRRVGSMDYSGWYGVFTYGLLTQVVFTYGLLTKGVFAYGLLTKGTQRMARRGCVPSDLPAGIYR